MPKKKKRKASKQGNSDAGFVTDLKGIGLILITIIGCLPFGKIAEIIRGFAAFLVGDWWAVLFQSFLQLASWNPHPLRVNGIQY